MNGTSFPSKILGAGRCFVVTFLPDMVCETTSISSRGEYICLPAPPDFGIASAVAVDESAV